VRTLAIETSGRSGEVALVRDGACLEHRGLQQVGRRHAQTLVAEIDELLAAHELAPQDVNLVAVSIGPGSFTGLRVGVVCAKTFAWATGAALAAVDTFACIAENAVGVPPSGGPGPAETGTPTPVFVIGDAQRGDLYVGEYARDASGTFARPEPIRIVPAEPWCRARSSADVVTGPGIEPCLDLLEGRCRLLPPESREPRAVTVAKIGERMLAAGETADPFTLEPFYLRKSAAEETWEAQHG
jgi:tRNA threonylcarbamoyladenosine biosynthesis protein TsaB